MPFATALEHNRLVEFTRRVRKNPIGAYGTAIGAVILATLVRWMIGGQVMEGLPFFTYYPTIIIVTFIGGFWPGLLAVVLSTTAAWYFFFAPVAGWELNERQVITLLAFIFLGSITVALVALLNVAIERVIAQAQALRESETRKTAILESALDAIIVMDQDGHIVDFNPAAEELFGYRRDDVMGKSVADTIIPERLREAHWTGLRRFLQTGTGKVVGRRVEMPALRSVGTEFASELAITATFLGDGQPIFTAYLRDITERKRAAETEKLLNRELEHRTSNLLAVIDAMADRSLRGNRTLEQARNVFHARVESLARTHRQLTKTNWAGLTLKDVVRLELEPFQARTKVDGSNVMLNPRYTQNFSLALHELATNATKYGALSVPDGEITVHWEIAGRGPDARLIFQWREHRGPPVTPPVREGFGTSLLRSTLGTADIDYASDGFCYAVDLPLAEVAATKAQL